ncbi:hypothetical protein JOE40_002934 [Arthrobacter sp. PvP102]|uniref:hypothetical protein n=1 Tax=unclassified Arthrobacter TaxID=235627 RepID=UPI001AE9DA64|nr:MULTISPECIES: hypothetical protein [unclassified Arthrobacter]MBP1233290.1 hypothetical protein [Arthrobacter sp. PvP103]MBP1238425.1 hypothetical protein [Arthrobacter sp. PvP102]
MATSLLKMVLSVATALALALMGGSPATAGPPRTPDRVGIDVSWPQCGKTLPEGLAFAIVGVNNGLANNTNPCLGDQLDWADSTIVEDQVTSQPRVALYVNTANPGLAGSWWPKSNFYMGTVVDNPYGKCQGKNDKACAYMYGYAKAYDDAVLRGVDGPEDYFWWLDVEAENSWQADTEANRADLEGMTAYFESIGADVGIYSTGYQWGKIAGTVPSTSNLAGLPSWLAGARTLKGAKSNCSLEGLTPGSTVEVTQYVSNGLDYNYACE